ncbi:MAG: hypothetical protein ACRCTZ_01960 [Sarcina sp.]
MKINLLIEKEGRNSKPLKNKVVRTWIENRTKKKLYEIGLVNVNLIKNSVSIELSEFVDKIANKGHTWTLASFKEGSDGKLHRTKQCWKSQSVMALDFDDGITPGEVLDRCRRLNIMPSVVYKSFSDSEAKRKFRVVFILDKTCYEFRDINLATRCLMGLFPESDEQCKDPNRLYFGGKGEIIYSDVNIDNRISIEAIVDSFQEQLFIYDSKSAGREIKKLAEVCGVNINNNVLKKVRKNVQPYIYTIEEHVFSPKVDKESSTTIYDYCVSDEEARKGSFFTTFDGGAKKHKDCKYNINASKEKRALIERFDWDQARATCPLLDGFMEGTIFPFDDEFRGIALNLTLIKGGAKRLKEAIRAMPEASDDVKDYYEGKITYYNKYTMPEGCKKFCPKYKKARQRTDAEAVSKCHDCPGCGIILNAQKLKLKEIRKIEEEEISYKTVETAYAEMNTIFNNIMNAPTTNEAHLVKAPTGIGKTEMIVNYLVRNKNNLDGLMLVLPNHKLALEVKDRIVERTGLKKEQFLYAGELEEGTVSDKEVMDRYIALQSAGLFTEARLELKHYVENLGTYNNPDSEFHGCLIVDEDNVPFLKERWKIEKYLDSVTNFSTFKGLIIATHARMLHQKNKNVHTVIIDEDITQSLVQTMIVNDEMIKEIETIKAKAEKEGVNGTHTLQDLLDKFTEMDQRREMVIESSTTGTKTTQELIKTYIPSFNLSDLISHSAGVKLDKSNDICLYKLNGLPANKKYIILSATANEDILERIIQAKNKSMNVTSYDLGAIKETGNVILHCKNGRSNSRSALKDDNYFEKTIKQIEDECNLIANKEGKINVVSFAYLENKLSKTKIDGKEINNLCHFGACMGIDKAKGEDIIVLGTPHLPKAVYLLYLHACGVKVLVEKSLEYQKGIERNGFEFSFMTFNTEDLSEEGELIRKIQFYLIEEQLLQAIGRGRTLRTNSNVHVFSNLPTKGCTLYK